MGTKDSSLGQQNAKSISGSTLIELLGAIVVSGLILSVAAAGLGAVINSSRQADIKNTRRQELISCPVN
jgi:type II secretory pathway component PulJ